MARGAVDVFVARQAILDVKQEVYGYELLYRSSDQNRYTGVDGDEASLAVIRNVLLVIGSDTISGRNKIFVNFTKNLLLRGVASLLPSEIGVVEILEDVESGPELIKELKQLRTQGYTLALDDFILQGNEDNPFLELADIIKVDFRQAGLEERAEIARRLLRGGRAKLLAEKVETREEVSQAIEMGYSLFQGYFFCKPVIIARRDIPGYKINYLRILKELGAEALNFKSLQDIISHDPALALKLLKYINSSYFSTKQKVTSIKRALEFLGENEIKKWASIAVVMEFGKDQPFELLRLSLLRARMSETIAHSLGLSKEKASLFLMGLLSHMDVLLGRPMEEVLEEIPIGAAPKDALLGKPNKYKEIFDLVVAYEMADWASIPELTSRLGMDQNEVSPIYWESQEWVDRAFM
jgi:c-di-GMP-related signal transduction protein